jgi:putative redox protein
VSDAPGKERPMSRIVKISSGLLRYEQSISVGPHTLPADEPVEGGGLDTGPNPYELLMAALGSCASITVRMYAERKQWPLQGVNVELSWARFHAEDCAACESNQGMVDGIEMEISLVGDLTEDQRQRILVIANKCPVHRTLSSQIPISSRLARRQSQEVF